MHTCQPSHQQVTYVFGIEELIFAAGQNQANFYMSIRQQQSSRSNEA